MGSDELKMQFENPSKVFGPASFWFLNEKLDEDELSWQIKEMSDKGLSGYVMHARYGLEVSYLSEEWFKKINHIIKESEKFNMDAIIYDEVDWPSGMSGTKVLDDHPEYIMTYLDISWERCDTKKKVEIQLEEGRPVSITGAKFINGHTQEDYKFKVKDLKNLNSFVKEGKLVINELKDIDIIFIFIQKELRAYHPETAFPQPKKEDCPFHQPNGWDWYFPYGKYVDLLNPDAVDYFLKTTHEEYKKRFKDHFGTTITKIFTDEPGFYNIMREKFSAVQWSNIFNTEFKKEFKYSIVDFLPALVADIGDMTYKVRHDFWFMLTKMFEENFVKKLSDWCTNNNLSLIGHFRLCNPFLIWQMQYQGNVINAMRSMHIPGIDSLDNVEGDLNLRWGIDENVWQIPNKIATSVAHQYGKRRVMSESFALGGWKQSLEDLKILADWQSMMGINFLIPHAFHYSIASQRKRECPPSEFYQNTMWDNYDYFTKYVRRIFMITTDSAHVANIAILYPIESLWAEYLSGTSERLPWDISDDFSYITGKLLRANLDFDILDQDIFEECKIVNSKLEIRDEKYSVLVIPPMTTLRDSIAEKIIDFVKKGGKVLGLSMLLFKNNEGKLLTRLNSFFEEEFSLSHEELYLNYKNNISTLKTAESKNYSGLNLYLIKSGPLYKSDPIAYIEKAIEKMIDRDIKIKFLNAADGNVYYSHWKKENKDIYFIVNSDDKSYELEISLNSIGKPYIWNPENGSIKELSVYRFEKKYMVVQYNPKELESNFIIIEKESIDNNRILKTNLDSIDTKNINNKKIISFIKSNQSKDSYIDLIKNGKTRHLNLSFEDDKVLKLQNKWILNRVDPNVLIINNWKMTQGFSEGSGWFNMLGGTVFIESDFKINSYGKEIKAVFDRIPQPNEISINDKIITNFKKSTYLDHQLQETDIKDSIKKGINKIKVKFELKERAFQGKTGVNPIEIMYDPVFIIGDFKLMNDDSEQNNYYIEKEDNLIDTGSWTNQGYPYFKGSMEFSQRIYIEKDFIKDREIFLLSKEIKEIVKLSVNNEEAGLRPWQPYSFNITKYLKSGENIIKLRVWNTLTNLLDLKKVEAGIVEDIMLISKEVKNIEI